MGDRLRDYGFMNPFRSNPQGSNYNASLAYLSGDGIDQWIVDTATYNKIIKDYGLTSRIEYKQADGSWGASAPQIPKQNIIYTPAKGTSGGGFTINPRPNEQGNVNVMPEYRWVVSGDINGANQALQAAGLQGTYTGPRGDNFITGAYIPATYEGKKVPLIAPNTGGGMASSGRKISGYAYIDSGDPLGDGINGSNSAFERTYNGQSAPKYYTAMQGGSASGDYIKNIGTRNATHIGASLNTDMQRVANEVFSNPNLGNLIYNPDSLKTALAATPAIRDTIGTYINDTAAYYRSRNDGGGALGVIAAGLGGVAQFASMASGLNALVTGLGSLASGLGLKGAFNAALDVAGSMPDIGSVVGGAAGSSTIGNLANIGVGGITGANKGGLAGGLLGAGGAAIGAGIDEAGGIKEFIKDPFGNIMGAVGLNGSLISFSPAQLAAMEQAAQIGPGSVAQLTPPSSIGQNVISTDYAGGIPHEVIEVVGSAGDAAQLGGGFGSSSGGAIGSALGGLLSGAGGSIGAPTLGGLSGTTSNIGTPGNLSGSIQTTAPGTTPTAGAGTGQSGVIGGPGGIGPDGFPIGTPGPFSDVYGTGAGQTGTIGGPEGIGPDGFPIGTPGPYSDAYGSGGTTGVIGGTGTTGTGTGAGIEGIDSGKLFGAFSNLMPGAWDYTGAAPSNGMTGLLSTGTGDGLGGMGTGGDGTGGDGLGGDGLGGSLGGSLGGAFPWGLLMGGQTGSIGDPASFITPKPVGVKKKGPGSFYGKLQAPKRRKGITVRRA